ncbi:hypothetical protein [Moorena bouillonii]|uniref:ThuA-like domain-containing protein n=1 Tax=Moorena bouillonii PNG TaxID=568701 RepID=A0A1U7N4R2_9CYAN|nr:hypothetical protein [Moorena bouillonii]OLT60904.1 hypothetical protein BJP37_19685 [Moorena bouillonii PNG]
MKTTTYLMSLVLLLLFSCKSSPETAKEETPSGPPQWLSISANEEMAKNKHIVLITGDEEYRSEEALPMLANILAKQHGFNCTVLFAQDPEHPGIVDPNYLHNIPGLESLESADLAFIFTRFRELPDEQMNHIQSYLMQGKPVIGIRTATHAFHVKDTTSKWLHYGNFYEGEIEEWTGGFGRLVLGEKWISHHGHHKHQSTRGVLTEASHPILSGIAEGEIWGSTDVYGIRLPMPGDSKPLVLGQVVNRAGEYDESDIFFGMKDSDTEAATEKKMRDESVINPNDPMMPIAWTKSYTLPGGSTGQSFASTIGSSSDMLNEAVRRMYINAAYHLMGLEVPGKANVEIVGEYKPTQYSFQTDEYWDERNIQIADYQ